LGHANEARNHVYGLGQKLASAYHDQPSGWGGLGGMMMMQPPPEEPPEDPDPPQDPPDTCYTRLTYYVNDQYGSVRAGMSGSTVLTKLEYYPYGEVYSMSGGGSVYTFLGKEGGPPFRVGCHVHYPTINGVAPVGPRYYNAMTGRFLSPDPS